jgi:hypothetical protein
MLIDPVFEKNIPGNLDNCINGNHDCDFWLAKTSGWGLTLLGVVGFQ